MSEKTIFIQTYGCRMNVCDSEIICTILRSAGFGLANNHFDADFVILNCCSVREDGHVAALNKAVEIKAQNPKAKTILCGCFAKLVSHDFLVHHDELDTVIAPESYRLFPNAINRLIKGESKFIVTTDFSDDLYSEIRPSPNSTTKNKAIILGKGCNQMCSYCIEPFTRGKERYASPDTVSSNLKTLFSRGEGGIITLVGHMVDRYHYDNVRFPELLDSVAKESKKHGAWVKYLSSHPMTFNHKILESVCDNENIMRVVHLPVQSGSDAVLKRMLRGYTVDEYLKTVDLVCSLCPDMNIVTDIMVGFCGETDADFRKSIELIERFKPGDVNVYAFSMRQHTHAYHTMEDDVPNHVKRERLAEARTVVNKIKHEYLEKSFDKLQIFMSGDRECQDRQEFTDLHNRTYLISTEQQKYPSNIIIKGALTDNGNTLKIEYEGKHYKHRLLQEPR